MLYKINERLSFDPRNWDSLGQGSEQPCDVFVRREEDKPRGPLSCTHLMGAYSTSTSCQLLLGVPKIRKAVKSTGS